MCILSYFPVGVGVDGEALFHGGVRNPDGHGWAIAAAGRIIMGTSMDLAQAIDEFTEARSRSPQGPALFHSRWATHGSKVAANCHPFYVGGGSGLTVVAHNGILPSSAHPAPGDDRSDTKLFAEDIFPRQYRRLDREGVRHALSQWCGPGNKLVILSVDPRYQRNAYVINEASGQWDSAAGVWHSNGDYKPGSARGLVGWSEPGECEWCGMGMGDTFGYCTVCRSCDYCGEHQDQCGCWFECQVCGFGAVDRQGYCDHCRSCWDCLAHARDCLCWSPDPVGAGSRDRLGR